VAFVTPVFATAVLATPVFTAAVPGPANRRTIALLAGLRLRLGRKDGRPQNDANAQNPTPQTVSHCLLHLEPPFLLLRPGLHYCRRLWKNGIQPNVSNVRFCPKDNP
jgi:hypothetical protein